MEEGHQTTRPVVLGERDRVDAGGRELWPRDARARAVGRLDRGAVDEPDLGRGIAPTGQHLEVRGGRAISDRPGRGGGPPRPRPTQWRLRTAPIRIGTSFTTSNISSRVTRDEATASWSTSEMVRLREPADQPRSGRAPRHRPGWSRRRPGCRWRRAGGPTRTPRACAPARWLGPHDARRGSPDRAAVGVGSPSTHRRTCVATGHTRPVRGRTEPNGPPKRGLGTLYRGSSNADGSQHTG